MNNSTNGPVGDQDGPLRDRLGEEWRDKIQGLDEEVEATIGTLADPADDLDDDIEEQRLAFADEEQRLPWLESDEEYEDDSPNTSRIVIIAILGLIAILGAVALAWWLSRPAPDAALVADGSTIEAPAGPIRERPADVDAEIAEGTGDLSFAAAEGLSAEEADGAAVAGATAPSIDRNQGAAPAGGAADAGTSSAQGVGVQVAAYSSRAAAQAGWNQLTGRYDSLSGLQNRIVAAEVNGATVYRLQAVAGTLEAAESLCRSLQAAGADCQVKR